MHLAPIAAQSSATSVRSTRVETETLSDLRARIRALERATPGLDGGAEPAVSTGAAAIDAALPWGGLPPAGLHEVAGTTAAAIGFCLALLMRLGAARPDKPVLWCQRESDLYGPGLAAFDFDPARLILLRARNDTDILWAMEEGLRSPGLAAVLGRADKVPPVAARRLQLAAESGGGTGMLLRPARPHAPSAAAMTRWRIDHAPSLPTPGSPAPTDPHDTGDWRWRARARWTVGLQRCRLGAGNAAAEGFSKPCAWLVDWSDETGGLSVVAELGDGSVEPAFAATGTG